jgi:hypothetical protein
LGRPGMGRCEGEGMADSMAVVYGSRYVSGTAETSVRYTSRRCSASRSMMDRGECASIARAAWKVN